MYLYWFIAYICLCSFNSLYPATPKKPWTFIIYIAADNDLRGFAARNIKQMAAIGSNEFVNICVELHIRISGNKKITRRYYLDHRTKEQNIIHVNDNDPYSQKMDSGDPKTLIACCSWFIEKCPAENYALILWNHGTGVQDPANGRIINSTELFTFNPAINKLELDRSVGFFDLVTNAHLHLETPRGICWDDSTGNYINNQKLDYALHEICSSCLQGKKLSIIGFDACLMAMVEIANITKKYAHIMVSSQEVELGTGWNYQYVLQPFLTQSYDKAELAQHIVSVYHKTYNKITNDYTLSALNLDKVDELEQNIHTVACLLLEALKKQRNNSAKHAIKTSRDKLLCTHFEEPSYIDLHHFYKNMLHNIPLMEFHSRADEAIKHSLKTALTEGLHLIKDIAFANTAGKNLSLAQGVSIYFPEHKIHFSYRKTLFAQSNEWITFLTQYLLL